MASRTCVLCQKTVVTTIMCRGVSSAVNLLPEGHFLQGVPHRSHPGVTNLKTLRLPEELQRAALAVFQNAQISRLPERAQSLTNFLWSRKRPVEDHALRQRAMGLEKVIREQPMSAGADDSQREVYIKRKVLSELKRTTYRWAPMNYDAELAVIYMAARLAGGYAAVRRALNEIKKREHSFAPSSLMDFGSGVGAAVWATHSCWGESLKEVVCVDGSGAMNTLAERLLKGDNDNAEPHIKQVYFRQFLPVTPKVQFDVVIAAFSLSELPSRRERVHTVQTLWRKTSSYLVLVENGTREGHLVLMEARDALLKSPEEAPLDPRAAFVFAPCPHELACPKLAQLPSTPCNFKQAYYPLTSPGLCEQQSEKFSYLVLGREGAGPGEGQGGRWPRLTGPVLRRPRHVHCHACCADGQLLHMVVTSKKHSRDVYRCARNSDWGDRLPAIPQAAEEQRLPVGHDSQEDPPAVSE